METPLPLEKRQEYLESEFQVMKDTIWRLTSRIFILEKFIQETFSGNGTASDQIIPQSPESNPFLLHGNFEKQTQRNNLFTSTNTTTVQMKNTNDTPNQFSSTQHASHTSIPGTSFPIISTKKNLSTLTNSTHSNAIFRDRRQSDINISQKVRRSTNFSEELKRSNNRNKSVISPTGDIDDCPRTEELGSGIGQGIWSGNGVVTIEYTNPDVDIEVQSLDSEQDGYIEDSQSFMISKSGPDIEDSSHFEEVETIDDSDTEASTSVSDVWNHSSVIANDVCSQNTGQKSTESIFPSNITNYSNSLENEKFPCHLCGKKFSSAARLSIHLRVHGTIVTKKFICDICDKRFKRSQELTVHRRIHTGEKPYSCPICFKNFTQSSSVTLHLAVHTGARPHVCAICSKSFTRISLLKKHLKICHHVERT